MVKPILELFISKETNPLHAQLVFTCHKPELINYLGKYRVLITEKNITKAFVIARMTSHLAKLELTIILLQNILLGLLEECQIYEKAQAHETRC